MTTKAKIAVSLPSELVEGAHRAVAEGRASSVSAYVAEAMEQKSKLDNLGFLAGGDARSDRRTAHRRGVRRG